MREFNLDDTTRVRLWTNDAVPDALVPELGTLELYYLSGQPAHASIRSVAIEYVRLIEPRDRYGLLGCSFYPAATGALRLAVQVASDTRSYDDGFLSADERVLVGLPVEYGPAVLVGVDRNRDLLRSLGPGKLVFDRAAHGEISSNQIVFTYLAQTLTALLARDELPLTEEHLRAALPA